MQHARNLFTQNKIAIIWDFDKTLIPYDMQRPLFQHYGVDEATIWRESNALPAYYRSLGYELVAEHYVVSSGLRQMILGSAIAPYLDDVWACELSAGHRPGPGFLDRPEEQASAEYDADPQPGEISGGLYAIDDTSKTRAIFEINKGSNVHPQISVNAAISHDDEPLPIEAPGDSGA
jgi:hypothetical protein